VKDINVSFEINDTWDVLAVARVTTPVIVIRPKSAMQARRFSLTRMFAFVNY